MKKILLLLIIIFSFVSAQEILMFGYVYSANSTIDEINTIPNAQVAIGLNSVPEGTLTYSNENGYYELIFDWNWDGPIPIMCTADGYDFYLETVMPNLYNNQFEFDIQLNPINSNEECTAEECGPPPMMPNYLCSDGITIAGPGDCIESANGECFWEIIECPIILGYLREIEVSDCQDACSQYYIEPEIDGGFGSISIIFQDFNINVDLYVNRFVEVDLDQEITCVECSAFQVLEINLSENCEFIIDCFQDPCIDAEECEINTAVVECIPNFCGACYADFYDLDGNLVDCTSTTEECFDFTGLDFGVCAMELGVGLLNDECNYISGCDWTIDGIDYSDLFFVSMDECNEVCDTDYQIDLGDINFDEEINVLDVVLLVSFILGDPTDEFEYIAADINEDNNLNVLDVVILINMILNPTSSIQINSGTSYGECWGYCVFELELDNNSALFKASSWGWDPYGELPDLILEDNLNQIVWQQLINLIDFEYFLSLEDVYGCPDCADGGAEFIEIIYEGVSKQVTFDAYTEIDGIQELTLLLRDLRTDYWNQINPNQECYIVPEVGPCDGICPTFYYNQSTNECEEFITGCCGVEVFSTLQECQNICE